MIYQYLDLQGNADTKFATYPLIPTLLLYKHQLIKTPIRGLIDSGAQRSYCHMVIGEYLRINFKKKKPVISTAANGTKFKGFLETINLLVSGRKIETPLIFSSQMNPIFPLVLGQEGFFSHFKICFNKSKDEFTVE
ncbi:hypothetical protein A2576_02290 [Candidatus Amesbacteria bacterium RIFOXYD1_FULL_47_9]|uniref:Peptidase A2 domain-containing protein n=4 Tax=Candidatus Amesiibacteriota TaxID=1752730 RepID=A0A1F4Z753_9BACT|nr:MAG: hypothetical protein UX78_C0002G0012 [Candidatus Amesbacteria bacterium GW2011_GWA2_47_11]KKU94611.1 MAG: hypothetical protein UY22_C0011G0018 [Candidatus Amesbacteria bacterium GW2011_GWC1_48_10]OGD01604.1 MAG: hypothetical protein A2354_04255 [Candidatus Amesbacteria bacterium RIFOXYB1_FULL_47_12]OGD02199.1 MAG: hypothetical protein A3E17_00705 [Candidatus Amesbacteria bacterium RIFCSPHIGHO2_12_FULL_48_14]OGD10986.1 MAG: hypothetical protein A2576_02290 [Candidatus Amesbacteria bacter